MSTRGEREQTEAVDGAQFHTRNVAERARDAVVLRVHHERASALDVTTVTHLTLTGTNVTARLDLFDVRVRTELLQQFNRLGRLLDGARAVVDDERHLRNALDAVTAREQKRRHGGRRERRAHRISLLLQVHASVPAAPHLGRREHATAAAHVPERPLTGAVRTAARNARNTRHGATGTPGFSRSLVPVRLNRSFVSLSFEFARAAPRRRRRRAPPKPSLVRVQTPAEVAMDRAFASSTHPARLYTAYAYRDRKNDARTFVSHRSLVPAPSFASRARPRVALVRIARSRRAPPHLTVVLVQPRVHGVDDVRTNRGEEDFGQGARGAVAALDGDHGERGGHRARRERPIAHAR